MKKLIWMLCILSLILYGCVNQSSQSLKPVQADNWGSFTAEKTFSYDKMFYAIQQTEETDDGANVVVSVYSAENDEEVYSFVPARAEDFWGICWENDTYNIWIQSADIGTFCYKYDENQWNSDTSAVRPDYIKSKYD